MQNEIWKQVAVCLLSAVLTGGGFWIVWGSEVPNREEVNRLISTSSPYALDQRAINESLGRIHEKLNSIEKQITSLIERVSRLEGTK
tara:strand:+ start:362 stop:622 length:261 start_codon:yes stop_codon:yes gene_type:complete